MVQALEKGVNINRTGKERYIDVCTADKQKLNIGKHFFSAIFLISK